MDNKVYLIWKKVGITPLQQLREFKYGYKGELPDSLTYAGRLDPMAEGLLPVVSGKNIYLKNRISYLEKTYETTILVGARTDSGDLLGVIESSTDSKFDRESLKKIVLGLSGEIILPLPRFSSKQIDRFGIFEDAIVEDEFRKSEILKSEFITNGKVQSGDILNRLRIAEENLHGDFRHERIKRYWNNFLIDKKYVNSFSVSFKVSGGTYIRSLVQELSKRSGLDMVLFSLKRIAIGEWEKSGEYEVL